MRFIIEALKETGGDTDAEKLAAATVGRTIDSPFGVDGTLTLRDSDNTLVNYVVGYGLTVSQDPFMASFTQTQWDSIFEHEAEWKQRNGYI